MWFYFIFILGKHNSTEKVSKKSMSESSKKVHHDLASKMGGKAAGAIYQNALEETKKELGDAIDHAVNDYSKETIGTYYFTWNENCV